jgi:hypothetical protein
VWHRANKTFKEQFIPFPQKIKQQNCNSLGVELFLELPCLHAEEVHLARVASADQMLPQKSKTSVGDP